jgi:hypothetical protein
VVYANLRPNEEVELTRKESTPGIFLQFSLEHWVIIERIVLEKAIVEGVK